MWSQECGVSIESELPEDINAALSRLTKYINDGDPKLPSYFDQSNALVAARAPGRLDVMGGIADYSGATVLQLPLRESTVVFCQSTSLATVTVISAIENTEYDHRMVSLPLSCFFEGSTHRPASLAHMRELFQRLPEDQQWVAYSAGVIPVLMQETDCRLNTGIVIYVCSTVPEGKGISSSAAIEVATMRAVTRVMNIDLDGHRQAVLCQQVENYVVGAPCGLMDQMTSSVGREGTLLRLLCQPDIVEGSVPLSDGLAVWGIDSGVRHAVSGSDYQSVRVAAFMGYRMMLDFAGIADARVEAADIVDERWQGFLANVSVSEFKQEFEFLLPESISGAEFLERYDGTTDCVTQINPAASYAVRVCTSHPIHEQHRVRLFAHLSSCNTNEDSAITAAQLMGECMYQSHASYSLCGIGSQGTDDLVERLRHAGSNEGVYGARITGGGSGGAVAVLAQHGADDLIASIATAYAANTGIGGQVFSGSSDGASVSTLYPDQTNPQ